MVRFDQRKQPPAWDHGIHLRQKPFASVTLTFVCHIVEANVS